MKMRVMKKQASLLCCGLLGLLAAGPAVAADKVQIGLAAIYPPSAIVYAAQELSIYKEKNLDVTITTFRSGPDAHDAMVAGAVDIISFNPTGVALAISKGIHEKVIADCGDVTPFGWHLAVPADSPIKTLKDLDGKSVGISSKASTTDFFALWAAHYAKIDFRTIPLGVPGIPPALKAKQVDAAILWPLVSFKSFLSGADRSVADFGALMEPVLPDVWTSTDEVIAKRPEVLRLWLQSIGKALAYMQAHEEWSLPFLKRYTEEQDDRVIKMTYDDVIKKMLPDFRMEPVWMQSALDLAKPAGITNLPGADVVFTTAFTPVDYH